jgi:inorganic pyrophosphatase
MLDEAGEDAKLICVPPREPRWDGVEDVSDLTPQLMAEIQHFFEVYKALEPDKYSSTHGIGDRDDAWREIEEARVNFKGGTG